MNHYIFVCYVSALSREAVYQDLAKHYFFLSTFVLSGEKGHSKKVKLSSAKVESWQPLSESSRKFLESVMDSGIL